jgi:hypothetical protein
MRARVVALILTLPLLASCGGAVKAASTSGADVGCGGWYAISHDVLTAEVQLDGAVHAIAVTAMLDDGRVVGTAAPVRVPAGSSHRTVKVPRVSSSVVSVIARVVGAKDGVRGSCELSSPH